MITTYNKYKEQLKIAVEALKTYADTKTYDCCAKMDCAYVDGSIAQNALNIIEEMNNDKRHRDDIKIRDGLFRCAKCKQYKSFDMFPKSKHEKSGHYHYCSECNKQQAKERRQRLKELKQDD
jgi:hypothetical protein